MLNFDLTRMHYEPNPLVVVEHAGICLNGGVTLSVWAYQVLYGLKGA